ncbi:Rv3235 family protein [Gordonia sp. LSe1-13]|uniref:Rv3235 family protein n=1 Tax=Gordonia sesuvii TaxID=3116777 RepID=A0ABU7MD00_9ACTN|nr:Rv3235 family protein [Gordonia sp. LSe1-13]
METPRVLIRPAAPYEPPPRPADHRGDVVVAVSADTDAAATREPATRQKGAPQRGATQRGTPPTAAVSRASTDARRFAIRAITLVLEVVDRRRSLAQLDPVAPVPLIDHVEALVRACATGTAASGVGGGDAAGLRRLHVQMLGPGAAEVFGSYRRGQRVRAFAGRIEQLPRRVRPAPGTPRPGLTRNVEYRWQLVAFTLV